MRKRFSNDIEPEIEYAPLGPVGCTDGARSTAASILRVVGSVETRSWLMLIATCAVCVSTSALRPTTSTVSETEAGPMTTSTGRTCVGASVTLRSWRWKPLNSNEILYAPEGSSVIR